MARLLQSVSGRTSSGTVKGINMGPTGQFGWGASTASNPQMLFQSSAIYSGAAVTDLGIFSLWFKAASPTFNDGNAFLNFEGITGINDFSAAGIFVGSPGITLRGTLKESRVSMLSTVSISANTWHHFLVSWTLGGTPTYATDVHMYLDDVDVKPAVPGSFLPGTIEWGAGNLFETTYRMGVADTTQIVPNIQYAAWYLNYNAYLDFSVTANRRKFIDGAGNPVALGTDGSAPTGSQPLFYFDDPVATLLQNRGSAGAFVAGAVLVDVPGPNP